MNSNSQPPGRGSVSPGTAGLSPGSAPQPIRLDGPRAAVIPLDIGVHGDALFDAGHGPGADGLFRYLADGPFDDAASFSDHLKDWHAPKNRLGFALLDVATNRLFGSASYMEIEPAHRRLEVGYVWFAPWAQRSAAATEAMFLMACHAFDTLGYRRYEWKCNSLNAASRAGAERLGFTYEGIFRNHMIVRGGNRDTAWFSMTAEEWPARKLALSAWLQPDNFDGIGRQLRSLRDCRPTGWSTS